MRMINNFYFKQILIIAGSNPAFFVLSWMPILRLSDGNTSIPYRIGLIGIALWAVLYVIRKYHKTRTLVFFAVIMLIPILILITILLYSNQSGSGAIQAIIEFLIFAVPAGLYGTIFALEKRNMRLQSCIIGVGILYTVSSLIVIVSNAPFFEIYGSNYQQLAYISATALIYFGYVYMNYDRESNFFILRNKRVSKTICILGMLLNSFFVIRSNGRGGAVLAGLFIIYFLVYSKNKKEKILLISAFLVVFVFNFSKIITRIVNTRIYQTILVFFTNPSLALDGEVRGRLYREGISAFIENPILGNGVGSVWYKIGFYSHNFFVDLLCEMGLTGLFIFMLLAFWMKQKIRLNNDKEAVFVNLILLISLVEGLFSGYYLQCLGLWFAIGYYMSIGNVNNMKREAHI